MTLRLFVSSVQKELAAERAALHDWLRGNPLMRRFFESFLFERAPAADRRADELYLDEVARCDVYVGLFGNEYGAEDAEGLSPTEHEFDHATSLHKTRLVFVKGDDDRAREPKMLALVRKAGGQVVRRRFGSTTALIEALDAALVQWLEERGALQPGPFDDRLHAESSIADIDADQLLHFVRRARQERQFALADSASVEEALVHLSLWRDDRPTHAALLLFGRNPQHFFPAAEVRCMHFHGTAVQRPAPFYQVFKGTVFALVDQAVDFVLSKIDYRVGTRALSSEAPREYEVPPDIVREAIVNAVAHRDYTQPASVQVSLFSDRIEVRNPGGLLPPLTPDALSRPHSSVTRNHRVAEALYLARYIEKYGTGTLMMIAEANAHALQVPDFETPPGEFVTVVWRDWVTPALFERLGLNERQRNALIQLRLKQELSNAEYQQATGAGRSTAKRDLEHLVRIGLIVRSGSGRGARYLLNRNRPRNGPNGPSVAPQKNGPEMAQTAHPEPAIPDPRKKPRGRG
jgi:ATP-dependent DNA helicase RecG